MFKLLTRLILALSMMMTLASCALFYHVLTPAEIDERGTRKFSSSSSEKLAEVSAVALQSLGYKVIQNKCDEGVCTVKTSPQNISTTAYAQYGSASLVQDGLAWQLNISPAESGSIVKASPKAVRNGNVLPDKSAFVAEIMDKKFKDLWAEINGNLN